MDDPQVVGLVKSVVDRSTRRWTAAEIIHEGGEAHGVLRVSARPMRREDTSSAMIVIEDVTQQRVADESRNSFVNNVAHELRSPLAGVRANIEMMIELGEENPADRAQCLNSANQEARRLGRIVNDLLSLAEIEAGSYSKKMNDVRLEEILSDLQRDYEGPVREKSITLEFELPPKLPVLHGDRDKLLLAMHNLVGNAVKYTPEGGRIIVHVDVDDDIFRMDVIDNGIGIPRDHQERIFEKMYRVVEDERVRASEGTGLGLAISREVIRLHGGSITVDSEPGSGSTFTLTLPRGAKAA
jgi:two-component system phosphate regulon sensor histidine kinase PhoR